MPWLLVNIALPMIDLTGRFIGDLVNTVNWSRVLHLDQVFIFLVGPLTMIAFGVIVLTLPDLKYNLTMLIPVAVTAFLSYLSFLALKRSIHQTIQSSLALLFIGSVLFLSI